MTAHVKARTTGTAALAVERLRFRYPGSVEPAIDGMSFEVAPAEIFGFLGPSGAGKSTTQRVMTGLLHGHEGEARVLGRPVGEWGPRLYERIGVHFELPHHFGKLTARENLAFFAALYRRTRDIDELLASLGLAAVADRRVATFSKGMQMRLNLARALLHEAEVLFLDEPTSGLDPVHAREVMAIIAGERERGRTVFLTTHDMAVADALCDRVAFVVDGRIAALDTPRALKLRGGLRRVRVECRGHDGERVAREFALDGLGDDPAFLEVLRAGAVETIHTTEATLADVFVSVTGRTLR